MTTVTAVARKNKACVVGTPLLQTIPVPAAADFPTRTKGHMTCNGRISDIMVKQSFRLAGLLNHDSPMRTPLFEELFASSALDFESRYVDMYNSIEFIDCWSTRAAVTCLVAIGECKITTAQRTALRKAIYTDIGPYAQFMHNTVTCLKEYGVTELIQVPILEFGSIRGIPDLIFIGGNERWLLDIKDVENQLSFETNAQIFTYAAIANMTIFKNNYPVTNVGIYDVRAGLIYHTRFDPDKSSEIISGLLLPDEAVESVADAIATYELAEISVEPEQTMSVKRLRNAAMTSDELATSRAILRIAHGGNIDAFFDQFAYKGPRHGLNLQGTRISRALL